MAAALQVGQAVPGGSACRGAEECSTASSRTQKLQAAMLLQADQTIRRTASAQQVHAGILLGKCLLRPACSPSIHACRAHHTDPVQAWLSLMPPAGRLQKHSPPTTSNTTSKGCRLYSLGSAAASRQSCTASAPSFLQCPVGKRGRRMWAPHVHQHKTKTISMPAAKTFRVNN